MKRKPLWLASDERRKREQYTAASFRLGLPPLRRNWRGQAEWHKEWSHRFWKDHYTIIPCHD